MFTPTQERILEFLLGNQEEHFSIRHVAKTLRLSYALTYHNIQDLLKRNILKKYSLPPAQIISLHDRLPSFILTNLEQKRAQHFLERYTWLQLYLQDVLRSAASPFFILLVFGSYAKGTMTNKSDIDLLTIAPTKRDIPHLEQALQHHTPIRKNTVTADIQQFLEMIKNPKTFNIGNESRKQHIILYGAEYYYQLLQKT